VEELLTFLEERLTEFVAPRGDEESFRLLDETRDLALARAEETFFSQLLQQECSQSKSLLLIDAGGSPRLAPKLLASLPSSVSVGYLRLDPNPASVELARSLHKPTARFMLVDPARAVFSDADWAFIRQRAESCVLLVAGCAWNAFLTQQQRFVENFFQRATLALASFLLPERISLIQQRLAAVKAKGALFDALRLLPVATEEGRFIYQPEQSFSLIEKIPSLPPIDGYYQLSVAIEKNPGFPLVNLFPLEYLQREIFAGFRFHPGPIAGEGQLFSLRFTH
jgi:hypothetical protein